jgi:hypothetical protein
VPSLKRSFCHAALKNKIRDRNHRRLPLGTVAFAKFIGQLTAGLLSLLGIKGTTDMKKVFSKVVHVVSAIKGDQSEFWAAATPRGVAAGQVQQALPPGWMAISRGWRLNRKTAEELKMCPNTVRRLTRCPRLERGRIVAAP